MSLFGKLFKKKESESVDGKRRNVTLDVSSRFQLDRHAFTGTMSKFHVAKEIATGDLFGIKFLDGEKTAYFNARFKGLNKPKEAEIAMKISHPKIVETYEYGTTTAGVEYILMEYIHGPGLDQAIRARDSKLMPNRLTLIREMAECIQAVHDQGFIHRDICPRNFICYEPLDHLKMIDFGLTVPDEPPYRMPGNRTGTPQYMAPEIVRRRSTDQRVDIFAFGVTVYRLLTFEHPWGSTDTTGTAALIHDTEEVTPITKHRPHLHPNLAAAIHKCLQVDPNQRMESCKRFISAIRNVEHEDAA
jgi:serine/threonine-protein kinase